MAITYPIELPDYDLIPPDRIRPETESVVAVSTSPYTYVDQVYAWPGQRWHFQVQYSALSREEAEELISRLIALNGREGTLLVGDASARTPRGAASGNPVVDGADQSGNTLAVRGFTPSVSGQLKRGDYLQIGDGSAARLYKCLSDADSDADGKAVLDIWPNLRPPAPADGAALIFNDAKGVFRLVENRIPWDVAGAMDWGIDFSVTEVL